MIAIILVISTKDNQPLIKITHNDTFDTRQFEGLKLHVYKDSAGKRTIGYGHNLTTSKSVRNCELLGLNHAALITGKLDLTRQQAEYLFKLDYNDAKLDVQQLPINFDSHPPAVQKILVDLSFNLGITKLRQFKDALTNFKKYDYKSAAQALKKSKWFKQTGNRSKVIYTELNNL